MQGLTTPNIQVEEKSMLDDFQIYRISTKNFIKIGQAVSEEYRFENCDMRILYRFKTHLSKNFLNGFPLSCVNISSKYGCKKAYKHTFLDFKKHALCKQVKQLLNFFQLSNLKKFANKFKKKKQSSFTTIRQIWDIDGYWVIKLEKMV